MQILGILENLRKFKEILKIFDIFEKMGRWKIFKIFEVFEKEDIRRVYKKVFRFFFSLIIFYLLKIALQKFILFERKSYNYIE